MLLCYHYNVAFSGLALKSPYGALESIRKLDGVYDAFVAQKYDVPVDYDRRRSRRE